MKPTPNVEAEKGRIMGPVNTNFGAFHFKRHMAVIRCIVGAGGGWDHVSVTVQEIGALALLGPRTPSWSEMCFVKDIFFGEDEAVVQYHPPKREYINNHDGCLHLWRPQTPEEFAANMVEIEEEARQPGCPPLPDYYPRQAPPPLPMPPGWMVGVKELGTLV